MAVADQLINLANQEQEVTQLLQNLYTTFPLQVRFHYGRNWFEQNYSFLQTVESVQGGEEAQVGQKLLDDLLTFLQDQIIHVQEFWQKNQLEDACGYLKRIYGGKGQEFLTELHMAVQQEGVILKSYLSQEENAAGTTSIQNQVSKLSETAKQLMFRVQEFANSQEQFRIAMQNINETIAKLNREITSDSTHPDKKQELMVVKAANEFDRQHKAALNCSERQQLLKDYKNVVDEIETVTHEVWKEIGNWQNSAKKALFEPSGPRPDDRTQVDRLDRLCVYVNEAIINAIQTSQQLQYGFSLVKYQNAQQVDPAFAEMESQRERLFKNLQNHLSMVFVVDRCPEQITKIANEKSHMFEASCMILGGKSLGLSHCPPKVTAQMFSENELSIVLSEKKARNGMCEVLNGKSKPMAYNRTKDQWSCYFSSVQLQKVKRPKERVDPEKLVTENMHAMVFFTTVKVCDREYQLATRCLPMVLISHVMQHWQAKATLIWDAAFSGDELSRTCFEHSENVTWKQVAAVLNSLFMRDTGKGLTQDHLKYLGRIALRKQDEDDLDNMPVTKNQLVRERIQKDLTFWKWFMACLNLIKEHLLQEWQTGLIYGFISKPEVEEKLKQCQQGTFILRFSERDFEKNARADVCGCLTLAVLAKHPVSNDLQVIHIKDHMKPVEISRHKLMTILSAFDVSVGVNGTCQYQQLLQYLYPTEPFQPLAEEFLAKQGDDKNCGDPYIKGRMRIHLNLFDNECGDNPNTPQTIVSDVDEAMDELIMDANAITFSDEMQQSFTQLLADDIL